jgi:16S rRNA (uracil1498-N3)-methyltransferase
MQVFYTSDLKNNYAILSGEEAHHCIHVLRKKVGDFIDITDGLGRFYKGEITETGKGKCVVSINQIIDDEKRRPYSVHLAIAPPKNPKRFDWLIEKLVEIGVDKITPIICKRSERRNLNIERLEKRMISAMKQSLHSRLPILEELISFEDWIESIKETQKFIAWVSEEHQKNLSEQCEPGVDTCILIGPEGDFTAEEIKKAIQSGFLPTALGKYRLRTETAGLTAITAVHTLNNTI